MAELEATVGGHVKKSSANEAAKSKGLCCFYTRKFIWTKKNLNLSVIAAPPLVSSSTKKSAVLQKPESGRKCQLITAYLTLHVVHCIPKPQISPLIVSSKLNSSLSSEHRIILYIQILS